jgi:hypothetical protein
LAGARLEDPYCPYCFAVEGMTRLQSTAAQPAVQSMMAPRKPGIGGTV